MDTNEGTGSSASTNSCFDCNICLETAKRPVTTMCGHLFCWPCIYRWMEVKKECPVCKSGVEREKVIPLYGRGDSDNKDPRDDIPEPPRGQRTEPPPSARPGGYFGAQTGHRQYGSIGGVTFTAGFGLFPGMFGMQYTFPSDNIREDGTDNPENLHLSRTLLMLGVFMLLYLLFF